MKAYIRIITLLLAALTILGLCACGDEPETGSVTKLSFKSTAGYDYLKSLDGTAVTINGYMATSSPADGSFLFLMNLPYQSCPFCKPNTSQLSNTIEVYPKDGNSFDYTTQAIKVVGTLTVAPQDKPFTDPFGYEFNFKLVDADYTILKSEDLSADMALWQQVAQSDIVTDIYAMYDYVNFLCAWNTYTVNSYTDAEGNQVPGYYLYAADALNYLDKDGAQFNYGTKPGYFDGIVEKIEKVDETAFSDLVANIRKAEALSVKARAALDNGEYTFEQQYVERFGTTDYVYTITNGDALRAEWERIYAEFADWLGGWEM